MTNPAMLVFEKMKDHPAYEINRRCEIRRIGKTKLNVVNMKPLYPTISLSVNKKSVPKQIHILVAKQFIHNPKPKKFDQVNHIDTNKKNYQIENLEWIDGSGNAQHARKTCFVNSTAFKHVTRINEKTKEEKTYLTVNAAEADTPNASRYCIYQAAKKNGGYHRGFLWKYNEPIVIAPKNEVWKAFPTALKLNRYEVSDMGRIRGAINHRIMKMRNAKQGYRTIKLYKNGICSAQKELQGTFNVHRLVAMTFCDGRTKYKNVVNHINENTSDNRSINLEWMTPSENSQHSMGIEVEQLDAETGALIAQFPSITAAAAAVGIQGSGYISQVCKGEKNRSTSGGFKWRFAPKTKPEKKRGNPDVSKNDTSDKADDPPTKRRHVETPAKKDHYTDILEKLNALN